GWTAAATLGQLMALTAMTDEERGANPMAIVYLGLDEDGKAIAGALGLAYGLTADEAVLRELDERLTSLPLSPYTAAAFRAVAYAWLRASAYAPATRISMKAGAAAKLTFAPSHPELIAVELLDLEIRRSLKLLDIEDDGRRLLGRARRQIGGQHYLTRRIEQVLAQ
ncbi:MAG TPA: hypothetical protein VLL76_00575, partial [Candidatus Omnitrophota bacterium]|nr:hypothetical protein [Candidatus Omnitrophota bacterium]